MRCVRRSGVHRLSSLSVEAKTKGPPMCLVGKGRVFNGSQKTDMGIWRSSHCNGLS